MDHRGADEAYGDTQNESYFYPNDKKEQYAMDLKQFAGGNYLKHFDLPKPYQWVTITRVTVEQVQGDQGEKDMVCVFFHGFDKPLGLNKGNLNILAEMLGWDDVNWPGKMCLMYRTTTSFNGKKMLCIRVAPIDGRDMEGQPMDENGVPVMFDPSGMPGGQYPPQQPPANPQQLQAPDFSYDPQDPRQNQPKRDDGGGDRPF